MNAFQMLLILGFPPAVAAASVAPEIFTDDTSDPAVAAESSAGK